MGTSVNTAETRDGRDELSARNRRSSGGGAPARPRDLDQRPPYMHLCLPRAFFNRRTVSNRSSKERRVRGGFALGDGDDDIVFKTFIKNIVPPTMDG